LITAHINDLIVLSISLFLELWLFVLLLKHHIFRLFPIFFTFALYTALLTVARLATVAHYRSYFFVYWWTEAGFAILSLAALHEVFRWVFEGFYRLWWFRVAYYGAIVLALTVAVWNAMANPPAQAHPVLSLILNVSIAINYVRLGIVGLFAVLHRLLLVPFRRYAYGIVVGFGISSAGPLLAYLAFSVFGTKLESFTRYTIAVAYILGVAIWVASFIRPEPEDREWQPPMSPDQMLQEVQGYLSALGISKVKK